MLNTVHVVPASQGKLISTYRVLRCIRYSLFILLHPVIMGSLLHSMCVTKTQKNFSCWSYYAGDWQKVLLRRWLTKLNHCVLQNSSLQRGFPNVGHISYSQAQTQYMPNLKLTL